MPCHKPNDGGREPAIATLREGWALEVVCHHCGTNQVTLDLTLEESQIGDVEVKKVSDEINIQAPHVEVTRLRRFVTGRPGETMSVSLDGKPIDSAVRLAEVVATEVKR